MNRRALSAVIIIILTVIWTLPTRTSFSQETETYGLAVLDLQAIGISEVEAKALSDMLRSSIVNIIIQKSAQLTDSYNLIERSQMDKIFKQFEIQNTGCTDLSCAVEFGKMLNVDRIIIGSVSLVGSTYMVIARIVDIESSRTINSVDRRQIGVIDNVIDLIPLVGHELLTGERLATPVPAIPSTPSPEIIKPVPTETSSPTLIVSETVGIKMISIPAGTFQMGSNFGEADEKPVHRVEVDSFEISETEITQGQYKTIMNINPSYFAGNDNLPVERVSWYDAVKFCNKLSDMIGYEPCYNEITWECDLTKNGFRLPFEVEWEYACRAGTKTKYYTGDSVDDLNRAGWYKDNSDFQSKPLRLKVPNAFGLYDMHGNVYEWCNDFYISYKYKNSNTAFIKADRYVARGGSWYKNANECRSSNRSYGTEEGRHPVVGIRIVRSTGGVKY